MCAIASPYSDLCDVPKPSPQERRKWQERKSLCKNAGEVLDLEARSYIVFSSRQCFCHLRTGTPPRTSTHAARQPAAHLRIPVRPQLSDVTRCYGLLYYHPRCQDYIGRFQSQDSPRISSSRDTSLTHDSAHLAHSNTRMPRSRFPPFSIDRFPRRALSARARSSSSAQSTVERPRRGRQGRRRARRRRCRRRGRASR